MAVEKNGQEPRPGFTGIFIPVEILEMEELTILEVMLLSWIKQLYCPEHGGCYASNEYLSKKLRGVQPNTIAKSLTKLRSLGLIEDVSFDGRKRVIRALIERHVDKAQSKSALDRNPIGVGQKSNPACDKNPCPSYIERKEEIRGGEKREKPTPQKNEASEKILRGKHVLLSEEEYVGLCERFEKTLVDEYIERVDDYCSSKDEKYKDYAATIRNWIKKDSSKTSNFKASRTQNETTQQRIKREQSEEYKKSVPGYNNIKRFE